MFAALLADIECLREIDPKRYVEIRADIRRLEREIGWFQKAAVLSTAALVVLALLGLVPTVLGF